LTTLFSSKGTGVVLGTQLGRGGEGAVFAVPHNAGLVAKVYHKPLDPLKQAKLRFMPTAGDSQLRSYVSWPTETLHSQAGGPVVGFLMPKVAGRDPIHAVYSPAHRRKERPTAAWDFLVFAARNTACAFESVHSNGHVIGDVNQDSLFVGLDSKVILIDSDSFQIKAGSQVYPCQVGVAMFTPPELQGISSFSSVVRTSNHDNFGLALLIFQLLFGGRHPFSGVPLQKGVGEILEADIKALRYAYATDAASRGIAPPPRPIPMTLVPLHMQAMFHAAFTERGATGQRPTAAQWVAVLDALRTSTRKCSASKMHVIPGHLSKCPWCELEAQGVVYFVDVAAPFVAASNGTSFDLTRVWSRIESIKMPPAVAPPSHTAWSFTPLPLPAGVGYSETKTIFIRIGVVLAGLGGMAAVPDIWFLILPGIWWGCVAAGGESEGMVEERKRRQRALHDAEESYNSLLESAEKSIGQRGFKAKLLTLSKLKEDYLTLEQDEKAGLAKLESTANARQKEKFLEGFFIDKADIPGIGPGRKATLRSFGIETAADVSWSKVSMVRGFGDSLTRAIVDWRAGIERRFVFNPMRAVTDQEKAAVRTKFSVRRAELAAKLNAGSQELEQYSRDAAIKQTALQSALLRSSEAVGQAKANMALVAAN
jgi:DNA-binding helix-hairpin-helix protein with protein kinase domain